MNDNSKKTKIAAIIYALILLLPSFLALPSVYHGEAKITFEGQQIDGGLIATVEVAMIFIFMWGFTTFVTYMLFKIGEQKKPKRTRKDNQSY